jgi:hypothetical protein
MKIPLAALGILLLATTPSTMARSARIDLFVMAGQSNMQGWQGDAEEYPADPEGIDQKVRFWWDTPTISSSCGEWTFLRPQGGRFPKGHFGPEVTFARLLSMMSGRDIRIFKYSLGSTSLAHDWKAPGKNGMYDRMIATLNTALGRLRGQGYEIVFKAFVWIQGESDADGEALADGYGERLKRLICDFRRNVAGDHQLPIILGVDEQHAWIREFPKVLEAQQRLAREDPHILFTSMIGLEKADGTHLSPEGLKEHGARLFAAYQELTRRGDAACSAP